ncbi:MAG: type I methionyl aminopeptidase [Planctomycetota bacterium]|nr:MAG: type I methionyl aminopeptidase [Planctomycetota bacterium]
MLVLRSDREIAAMRPAGFLVWKAQQLAASLIRPGITTREIDAAVEAFFAEHDAHPLFKGVPGPVPFPAVTCISVNEEVVHGIPGDRKLEEGDVVSIDTGCRVNGWCGDAAVTYPVGEISPEKAKLLEVTKGTLDLAIELMPKRRKWSEVAKEMAAYVRKAGFSVVEAFVGHGIGRTMHEDPQVPNFVCRDFLRRGDFPLRPGVVIAVEPMVNAGTKDVRVGKDLWTQLTRDGKPSAHFEHTLGLTTKGVYVLTGPPCELDEVFGVDLTPYE